MSQKNSNRMQAFKMDILNTKTEIDGLQQYLQRQHASLKSEQAKLVILRHQKATELMVPCLHIGPGMFFGELAL